MAEPKQNEKPKDALQEIKEAIKELAYHDRLDWYAEDQLEPLVEKAIREQQEVSAMYEELIDKYEHQKKRLVALLLKATEKT